MASKDSYMLTRGAEEARRLDLQHEVWSKNIGYLLHPSIASTLPKHACVADVGTGTAIWLRELSSQSPATHTFVGFDISREQFPESSALPDNVSLHVADAKQPFTPAFRGVFDAVHLRLLVAAMDESDWLVVSRNVLALLKPGGAIQWEEGDMLNGRKLRAGMRPPIAIEALGRQFHAVFRARFAYGFNLLPGCFAELGMERVQTDVVASDRLAETRMAMTKMWTVPLFIWARNQIAKGAENFWSLPEFEALEKEIHAEIDDGVYHRIDIHVTFGFKRP